MIYNYVNLYLYTNDTTTAPITTIKALKYKIVSSNKVTYSEVGSYMEDTLLATLPLEEKEINYTVYLYIDSTISLGNYNDKTYSGYLYASTEQTSTIGKEDNLKNNLGLQTIDFDYLGDEQKFITPKTGDYQLETWGAQGGNTTYNEISRIGGYGGYSTGDLKLENNQFIFINIGEFGSSTIVDLSNEKIECLSNTTFNGGGSAFVYNCKDSSGSGGGATHIAKKSGLLSTLEKYKSDILIISGGGGGSYSYIDFAADGGAGGGFKGTLPSTLSSPGICGRGRILTLGSEASQVTGGSTSGCYVVNSTIAGFGVGESTVKTGESEYGWGSGGGGGYIGNSLLTNKSMYCYNCEESTETSTKTISTTNVSENPISKYAKKGNGYARITVIN